MTITLVHLISLATQTAQVLQLGALNAAQVVQAVVQSA